jgi:UDP:flavonoid glycosyltransferase YjiC (YdhE family)
VAGGDGFPIRMVQGEPGPVNSGQPGSRGTGRHVPPIRRTVNTRTDGRGFLERSASMRVLVVTAPLLGYAQSLVPLAWELRTAGHEVLVATAGEAVRVAESGLPVANVARGFDLARTMRRMALRNPVLARAERAGRAGPRGVVTLFGEINDELADGAVAVADEWRPDLVVHDALAPVGALVAARRQVPAALCDSTLYDGHYLSFAATRHLSYAGGRHGVSAPAPPAAVIRLAPPSLAGPRPGWPMRFVPYDSGLVGAGQLDGPPPRPRIVVVASNPAGSDRALMRAVARAAAPVDADVVLVRPDLGTGPPLPANVRVVEWTPLSRLLPHSAGIVHHGGAATVLSALIHGVPQLVVPDAGERRHNAGLVYRRGVGLVGGRRDITPALLRRLVGQQSLAVAAAEVRAEMTSAPDPAEVAAKLAELPAG